MTSIFSGESVLRQGNPLPPPNPSTATVMLPERRDEAVEEAAGPGPSGGKEMVNAAVAGATSAAIPTEAAGVSSGGNKPREASAYPDDLRVKDEKFRQREERGAKAMRELQEMLVNPEALEKRFPIDYLLAGEERTKVLQGMMIDRYLEIGNGMKRLSGGPVERDRLRTAIAGKMFGGRGADDDATFYQAMTERAHADTAARKRREMAKKLATLDAIRNPHASGPINGWIEANRALSGQKSNDPESDSADLLVYMETYKNTREGIASISGEVALVVKLYSTLTQYNSKREDAASNPDRDRLKSIVNLISIKRERMTEQERAHYDNSISTLDEQLGPLERRQLLEAKAGGEYDMAAVPSIVAMDEKFGSDGERRNMVSKRIGGVALLHLAGQKPGFVDSSVKNLKTLFDATEGQKQDLTEALVKSGGDIDKAISATKLRISTPKPLPLFAEMGDMSGVLLERNRQVDREVLNNLERFKVEMEGLNLDASQRKALIFDTAKATGWTENDTDLVRLLSTGEVIVNTGQLFGRKEQILAEIGRTATNDTAKEIAKLKFLKMRKDSAESIADKIYYADSGYAAFERERAERGLTDREDNLDVWGAQQRNRAWLWKFGDAVQTGVTTGGLSIYKTSVGTLAGGAALVGAGDLTATLAGHQMLVSDTINGQNEAAERRSLTGGYGIVMEASRTITEMAPMLLGAGAAGGLKTISGAVVRGMSVYGWAAAQGYESKLSDAVEFAKAKAGGTLSPEQAAAVLADPRTQIAGFLNAAQGVLLAKILPKGSQRIGLGNAARSMTAREFISKGGLKALRDGTLRHELGMMAKTIFKDATDEGVEEFTNQILDGAITCVALGEEVNLGDLLGSALKSGLMGMGIGAGMNQVRSNSRTEGVGETWTSNTRLGPTAQDEAGADARQDSQQVNLPNEGTHDGGSMVLDDQAVTELARAHAHADVVATARTQGMDPAQAKELADKVSGAVAQAKAVAEKLRSKLTEKAPHVLDALDDLYQQIKMEAVQSGVEGARSPTMQVSEGAMDTPGGVANGEAPGHAMRADNVSTEGGAHGGQSGGDVSNSTDAGDVNAGPGIAVEAAAEGAGRDGSSVRSPAIGNETKDDSDSNSPETVKDGGAPGDKHGTDPTVQGTEVNPVVKDRGFISKLAESLAAKTPLTADQWLDGNNGLLGGRWTHAPEVRDSLLPLAIACGASNPKTEIPRSVMREAVRDASPSQRKAFGIRAEDSAAIDAAARNGEASLDSAVETAMANRDANSDEAKHSIDELASKLGVPVLPPPEGLSEGQMPEIEVDALGAIHVVDGHSGMKLVTAPDMVTAGKIVKFLSEGAGYNFRAMVDGKMRGGRVHVAFETTLVPGDRGKSERVHANRANTALEKAMKDDPEFAAMMELLIPGIMTQIASKGGRQYPKEWTWHHSQKTGVMQLVIKGQHQGKGAYSFVLHPNGRGGYAIWAIPAGAPPRKRKKP